MIQVKIDDTIVDIIDKITAQKTGDIILDFPLGHPVLHNYISLKILKSQVAGKKLIIATSDRIGKKIWTRLGIEYSLIKDRDFLQEDSKGKLMEHNFTFWEYFKFQIHSYGQEIKRGLDTNKKLNSLGRYSHIYQEKTSIHIFLWALIISLLIFLFIYYFAISKTYISISPKVIIKKEAHNFIFNENTNNSILWNNKNIKITTLSETIHSSDTYAATQIKRNPGNISQGTVRIYNTTSQEITLVPQTRLQSTDGLVFETNSWVKLPAGIRDNFQNITPGYADILATSQDSDTSGKYIGSRGNIAPDTPLSLPGLSPDQQKDIYAQSITEFSGGSDTYERIVSQEDMQTASDIFTQKIKTEVINSIKNNILQENIKNNTQIGILSWGKSVQYSEPIINLQAWVEPWDTRDSFTISWSITAYVYTYNKSEVIQKLKTLLNEKNLTGIEKIEHIDTNSLRMSEIIYSNKSPFEIKATFEIEALFLHDFLHKDNTYITTLKSEIRWLNRDDAERILLNNPKISNVSIDIRPFFTKKVSNIYNNIIFKVE